MSWTPTTSVSFLPFLSASTVSADMSLVESASQLRGVAAERAANAPFGSSRQGQAITWAA
ncbi:hypothetical protein [Streptomyces sp. NPDC002855]|uniref:hypothetical protein n=1 Tax=Streptomyces sp. NPDC002855 TaxID=3154437 RepID=UPI003323A287